LDRRRGREGGGAITGWTRRRSRPMTGPQRRLRTINTVGSGTPKTAGGVRGSATGEAQRPSASGRRFPPSDATGSERDGRAQNNGHLPLDDASSSRVPGAVAHLSKRSRAARRRDAIADRMLGMGDHRPDVGRGRMMAVSTFDVCSNAAVNSDLSCFL